jgi:hypothetical protein
LASEDPNPIIKKLDNKLKSANESDDKELIKDIEKAKNYYIKNIQILDKDIYKLTKIP